MAQHTGMIKMSTTFPEERLDSTRKRLSYRPTGTHLFPRSVSVWRLRNRSSLLSSTSRPILCTHWSLTGDTAPLQWVATHGRRWLVHRPLFNITAIERDSILFAVLMLKLESVSSAITKMLALRVIPGLGLVQEVAQITPLRVETQRNTAGIMGIDLLKPWDTSWYIEKKKNQFCSG